MLCARLSCPADCVKSLYVACAPWWGQEGRLWIHHEFMFTHMLSVKNKAGILLLLLLPPPLVATAASFAVGKQLIVCCCSSLFRLILLIMNSLRAGAVKVHVVASRPTSHLTLNLQTDWTCEICNARVVWNSWISSWFSQSSAGAMTRVFLLIQHFKIKVKKKISLWHKDFLVLWFLFLMQGCQTHFTWWVTYSLLWP